MTDEKPLHVRVAEALGCKPVWGSGWMTARPGEETWLCRCENHEHGWDSQATGCGVTLRYDTDWSATGPLIEKYLIRIGAPTPQDSSVWGRRPKDGDPALITWDAGTEMLGCDDFYREGTSPLIAVCNLILALKEAGKL